MVIFKDTVRIKKWTPALSTILETLAEVDEAKYQWMPDDTVITSINDSEHMNNSRHYIDEAIDVRSKNFKTEEDKLYYKELLTRKLGDKFTVLFEYVGQVNEHFHIQVARGKIYP